MLRVEYVVAGTYTVRSDGPTQIVRVGGAGTPEAIPAATPVDLGPGDALVVPFETASDYTNQGEIPMDLVQWRLHEDGGRAVPHPRSVGNRPTPTYAQGSFLPSARQRCGCDVSS